MNCEKNIDNELRFEFSGSHDRVNRKTFNAVKAFLNLSVGISDEIQFSVADVIAGRCTRRERVAESQKAGIHLVCIGLGRRTSSFDTAFFVLRDVANSLGMTARDVRTSLMSIYGSRETQRRILGKAIHGISIPIDSLLLLHAKAGASVREYSEYVYFAQPAGMPFVKIGYGIDPQKRVMEGQTWSPFDLEIIALRPGGSDVEADYHRRFSDYRVRGEWFQLSSEIVAEIRLLRKFGPDDSHLDSPSAPSALSDAFAAIYPPATEGDCSSSAI